MNNLVTFFRKNRPSTLRNDSFYDLFDGFFSDDFSPVRNFGSDIFKMDVEETESSYVVTAEMPGIKKEEISLDFNDGKLTISVKREETSSEEKKNFIQQERLFSSMTRSICLADADAQGATAKLEDGVLTFTLKKKTINKAGSRIQID